MKTMIVGTTPTVEIIRQLTNPYTSVKTVFWNTNPYQADIRLEKQPRLDSSKPNSFFFDFSEADTQTLATTGGRDGELNFQIYYTYDEGVSSNSESSKELIKIKNSPTTAGATGSGGADTSLVYQAVALQPNVPIGGAGPTDVYTKAEVDDLLKQKASTSDIPTKLPNPQSLTFTGAVTGVYDGSKALSVNIPSGGSTPSGEVLYPNVKSDTKLVTESYVRYPFSSSTSTFEKTETGAIVTIDAGNLGGFRSSNFTQRACGIKFKITLGGALNGRVAVNYFPASSSSGKQITLAEFNRDLEYEKYITLDDLPDYDTNKTMNFELYLRSASSETSVYTFEDLSTFETAYYYNENIKEDLSKTLIAIDNQARGTVEGLTMAFLGDSITAASWENSYPRRLANALNCQEYTNVAVAGATFLDTANIPYDGNPIMGNDSNTIGNQVTKLVNGDYPVPDVIVIAAGINGGIPSFTDEELKASYMTGTGSSSAIVDISTLDRMTSEGIFRWCTETLHTKFPNALVCWCAPLYTTPTFRPPNEVYAFGENLRKLCEYGAQIFIDNRKSGMSCSNAFEYGGDGVHPNSRGAELVGNYMAGEIGKYIERIKIFKGELL